MKKILTLALALTLGACAGDYYHNEVRYSQSGDDCRYTFSERGNNKSRRLDHKGDILYRDTKCRNIMAGAGAAKPVKQKPVSIALDSQHDFTAKPIVKQTKFVPVKPACGKCTRKIVTSRPSSGHRTTIIPATY